MHPATRRSRWRFWSARRCPSGPASAGVRARGGRGLSGSEKRRPGDSGRNPIDRRPPRRNIPHGGAPEQPRLGLGPGDRASPPSGRPDAGSLPGLGEPRDGLAGAFRRDASRGGSRLDRPARIAGRGAPRRGSRGRPVHLRPDVPSGRQRTRGRAPGRFQGLPLIGRMSRSAVLLALLFFSEARAQGESPPDGASATGDASSESSTATVEPFQSSTESDPTAGGEDTARPDRPYWRQTLFGRFFRDQKFLFTTWWPSEFRRTGFTLPLMAGSTLATTSGP